MKYGVKKFFCLKSHFFDLCRLDFIDTALDSNVAIFHLVAS